MLDQAFDAYAALRYLSQLEDVDPARVAVLGQSMGGASALSVVDRDMAAQYFSELFMPIFRIMACPLVELSQTLCA